MIPALLSLPLALAAPPQDGPADLSDGFELPDGLAVSLWAESPMLYNPTALDVDARGRVWVAEAVNYRRWGGRNPGREHEGGDRIVILTDSDGDGVADLSQVFAQDRELVAPLGICVLDDRVFVSCSPDIFVYTDVDGDDVADERAVFLTGFGGHDHDHGVHSVVAGDDGWLYIAAGNAGPHLVTDQAGFELRSGSLYTGGSPYNSVNQAGMESSDGRVWVGGLILRVRPDGTGLQVVAHNFRNEYEVARDSLGNLFTADNDDDGNRGCRTSWVVEGGNYGYFSADGTRSWRNDMRPGQEIQVAHWHADDPGVMPPGTINGAGGPTGVAVYECEFAGSEMSPYDGAVLNCDAGAGVVYAHLPRRRGAGLELDASVFLGHGSGSGRAADDGHQRWFRPSDVVVAPDGSVLVADWYDPGVGGHGMGDREAYGRILRVAGRGAAPAPEPLLYRDATAAEIATDERVGRIESHLLNALCSPAVSVRARAREELLARGDSVYDALHDLAGDPSARVSARAVEVLARLSSRGRAFVEQVTRHPVLELRVAAFRALLQAGDVSVPGHRRRLVRDTEPFVRASVARTLRDLDWEACGEELVALALQYEGNDRAYLESLGIGATGKESRLLATLSELHAGGLLDGERFRELLWRLHPGDAVGTIAAFAGDVALPVEERRAMIDALAFVPTRPAADAMYSIAHAGPLDLRAYATWWLGHRAENDWRAFGLEPAGAGQLAEASLEWSSGVRREGVIDVSVDLLGVSQAWLVVTDGGDGHGCDWADWIAPRFVLEDGSDVPLASLGWTEESAGWGATRLHRNCDGGELRIGDDVFEEGIGTHAPAFIAFTVPAGARRLVAQAGPDFGGTRQGCGSTMEFQVWTNGIADRSGIDALRARVEDGSLSLEDRVAAARELAAGAEGGLYLIELAREGRLTQDLVEGVAPAVFANPDLGVRALASAHFPRSGGAHPGGEALPSVGELLSLDGSPARGREVFLSERAQCSSCHAFRGRGQDIGPDLTAIGEKYAAAEVLDAILNPSAAIAFGYDSYVVRTTGGVILAGFVLAQAEDLVLRDTSGARHVVPGEEIDVMRRQEISVMPEGVALGLEAQEVADLLAFLLDGPAREPRFGAPIELFNGRDLAGWTHHLADASAAPDTVWSVADGVLRCAGRPAGYIRTVEDFTSYELTLEWRFDPEKGAGNSGVLLRMVGADKVWPKSIEAQLHSGNAGDIWNIDSFPMEVDSTRTRGRRTQKALPTNEVSLGEWNRYRIRMDRGELTLEVNGRVQNRASWCEEVPGKICLQSEGAWIEFRNIVLRPIVN